MSARITRCSILGLKGSSGEPVQLDPCTLVVGPNGAGKTALLDGIALGLLGYHPTAGRGGSRMKDPAELVQRLAADGVLQIELTCETEAGRRTVSRRWEQSVKDDGTAKFGKPTLEVRGGGQVVKGKEAELEVRRLLGEPTFLDVTEWLALSDERRRGKLLELLPATSPWTEEQLWAEAAACGLTRETLEQIWARPEVASRQGASEVCRLWAADELALRDWLAQQQTFLAESSRDAADRCRGLERAIAELDGDAIDAHQVAELLAARTAAEQARTQTRQAHEAPLAEAKAELARLDEQADAATQARSRLAEIRQELARHLQESGGRVPEIERQIAALTEEAWGDPSPGSLAAYRQEVEEAAAAVPRAEELERTRAAEEQEAGEAASRNREELAAARARQVAAVEQQRVELEQAQQAETQATTACETIRGALADTHWGEVHCPTCLQAVDPSSLLLVLEERQAQAQERVRQLREQARETAARIGQEALDAQQREKASRQWAERAHQSVVEARRALETRRATLRQREQDLQQAELTLERLRTELQVEQTRAASAATVELGALRQQERDLVDRVELAAGVVARQGELGAEILRLEQQLRLAEAQATERWTQADRAYTDGQRRLQRKQDLDRLRADLALAEEELLQLKAVVVALGPRGLQGRLLAVGLKPLVGTINTCIEGLGLGRFDLRLYDERGGEVCWPGVWVQVAGQERWRHLESLSGGESATLLALFLAGLANLGRSPLRLLTVDGLERVDRTRRGVFLAQAKRLQEQGLVDQVLITGCPDEVQAEGYQVVSHWAAWGEVA